MHIHYGEIVGTARYRFEHDALECLTAFVGPFECESSLLGRKIDLYASPRSSVCNGNV